MIIWGESPNLGRQSTWSPNVTWVDNIKAGVSVDSCIELNGNVAFGFFVGGLVFVVDRLYVILGMLKK